MWMGPVKVHEKWGGYESAETATGKLVKHLAWVWAGGKKRKKIYQKCTTHLCVNPDHFQRTPTEAALKAKQWAKKPKGKRKRGNLLRDAGKHRTMIRRRGGEQLFLEDQHGNHETTVGAKDVWRAEGNKAVGVCAASLGAD